MDDRPIYGTKKLRAEDLRKGDVTRNHYGKWDVITETHFDDDLQATYCRFSTECGGDMTLRRVHLVDVQYAKPS